MRNEPRQGGFTLVELILSMAVMVILMGGISSAMLLASRAVPDRQTALTAVNESYQVLEQINAELATAKTFNNLGTNQVVFTVADRNADGVDETIRYIWSGVVGTELKRMYNADALTTALADVQEFQLDYDKTQVPFSWTPAVNESDEMLLVQYNLAGAPTTYSVNSTNWIGQYFKPTMPAGATSWRVTRVRVKARASGGNAGLARLELRTASGSYLPTTTVLGSVGLMESTLSDKYLWKEFAVSSGAVSASSGVCMVFKWLTDTSSCEVQRGPAGSATGTFQAVSSSTAGASWSVGTEAIPFQVYGTVTSTSGAPVNEVHQVLGVRIRLRTGSEAAAGLDTNVQVVNQPEVAVP